MIGWARFTGSHKRLFTDIGAWLSDQHKYSKGRSSICIIVKRIGIINVIEANLNAYDHTTLNAPGPVPVRSPKLSSVGPDQYLDG